MKGIRLLIRLTAFSACMGWMPCRAQPILLDVFGGYLEPCGCSQPQLGGLARRATAIRALGKDSPSLMLLSNGDLVKGMGRQSEIKFRIVMEAMKALGYAAHNAGAHDLMLGQDLLKSFPSDGGYPRLISANVYDGGGRRVFDPYVVIRGPTPMGVVGVISDSFAQDVQRGGDGLFVEEPGQEIRKVLGEMGAKHRSTVRATSQGQPLDYLVLMAYASLDEGRQLARHFPEFNLVVCGLNDEPLGYPVRVNDTVVVTAGTRGKHLVSVNVPTPAATLSTTSSPSVRYSVIALGPELADDIHMKALLGLYQEMLKSERLLETRYQRLTPSGKTYAGSSGCSRCHEKQHRHWQATRHARAFDTLRKANHEYDPECVRCHVTGFDFRTGFLTAEKSPDLTGVGCEACHGPLSGHAKEPKERRSAQKPEATCIGCHEAERSPRFRLDAYLHKVSH